MATDRGLRVSDQEREYAAEVLRKAYTAGCLDLDELHERTYAAYAAKTRGELSDLTADLPPSPDPCYEFEMRYARQRPMAVLWMMGIVGVAIVAAARLPAAVVPLILLVTLAAVLALRTVWRRASLFDGLFGFFGASAILARWRDPGGVPASDERRPTG